MASTSDVANIIIQLVTKQSRYAVPDTLMNVKGSVSSSDLTEMIKFMLKDANPDAHYNTVEFDFIINDELLRSTLIQHLESKSISTEHTIVIEYVEATPPPEIADCLMHDDWVSAVHVNDNWVLTGCYDHTIHIWDKSGKHLYGSTGHQGPVKGVSWLNGNENSALFVSVSHDQNAILWEWSVEKKKCTRLKHFCGHMESIESVSAHNDKIKFATGSWDNLIKIWSTAKSVSGELRSSEVKRIKVHTEDDEVCDLHLPLSTLKGHNESVSEVKWIDDDLLSASNDHTIRIWDVEIGGTKHNFVTNKAVLCVDSSPLNRLIIAGGADVSVRLYDPRSTEGSVEKKRFVSHNKWIYTVKWSPTNPYQFLSGSFDKQAKLWDVRSETTPLYDLIGCDDKIICADWSQPELVAFGSADCALRLCGMQSTVDMQKRHPEYFAVERNNAIQ